MIFGLLNLFRGGSIPGTAVGTQKQRFIYATIGSVLAYMSNDIEFVGALIIFGALLLPWYFGTGRPMSAINNSEEKELKEFWLFDIVADFVSRGNQRVWGITFFACAWLFSVLVATQYVGLSACIWLLYGVFAMVGATIFKRDWWKGAEFFGGYAIGLGVIL